MPMSMNQTITRTETADSYQITSIGVQFYIGNGPSECCQLDVRGRKGTGDGADFVTIGGEQGRLETTFDAQATLDLLNSPVSSLPQDATLLNALLAKLDAALKARGVV